jgi:hypothetical protein
MTSLPSSSGSLSSSNSLLSSMASSGELAFRRIVRKRSDNSGV